MTTTHPGHGRIVCSCGRVIAQCRCLDNTTVLETRQHPACGVDNPMMPMTPAEQLDNAHRDRERARQALVEIRDLKAANAKDYEQHVRALAQRTLFRMSGVFDE